MVEGLQHAPDPISRAQLLMIKAVSARLWRGSEPFGQGTEPDPVPIDARIAAVNEALEIGRDQRAAGAHGRGHRRTRHPPRDRQRLRHGPRARRQRCRPRRASSVHGGTSRRVRTAAVHAIHIEAVYEKGLELGRRARALSEGAEPHQRMHALYPIIVALYRLGRWDELAVVVDEHAAVYVRARRPPASSSATALSSVPSSLPNKAT